METFPLQLKSLGVTTSRHNTLSCLKYKILVLSSQDQSYTKTAPIYKRLLKCVKSSPGGRVSMHIKM